MKWSQSQWGRVWQKSGDRREQELENGERLIPAKNLFCKKGIKLHLVNHYPQELALGFLNLKEMGVWWRVVSSNQAEVFFSSCWASYELLDVPILSQDHMSHREDWASLSRVHKHQQKLHKNRRMAQGHRLSFYRHPAVGELTPIVTAWQDHKWEGSLLLLQRWEGAYVCSLEWNAGQDTSL